MEERNEEQIEVEMMLKSVWVPSSSSTPNPTPEQQGHDREQQGQEEKKS